MPAVRKLATLMFGRFPESGIDAEARNLAECLQRIQRDGRTHDGSQFE